MTEQDDATMSEPPALDAIAHDYVTLAFGIERHLEGVVDAFYGPPEVRTEALAGDVPAPGVLFAAAEALGARIVSAALPEHRVAYLLAQVRALATICRTLAGESIPYREEVRLLFEIEATRTADRVYDEAIAKLDDALPGDGSTAERMIAWRRGFEITPEQAQSLIDVIAAEARRRTAAIVTLPDDERVTVEFVQDKPWSGYNWYLGAGRSRVELNTDLPLRANTLLGLICHEAYPGHHSENAIKERYRYRERGYGEHAILLINTPECLIAEGIATLAEGIIFPPDEVEAWKATHVYAPVGITVDPARETQIAAAQRDLESVAANAALLLHEDGAPEEEAVAYLMRYGLASETEARQRLRFIASPQWRGYIFTYHAGRQLLGAWLQQGDQTPRFAALLHDQFTPSAIARKLDAKPTNS